MKIADFGLAKSKNTTMTMGIGTPAYMAPELFKDDEDLTEPLKLDVYAIGVIMWELWTRTKPFFGRNVHYVVTKVIDGIRPNMVKVDSRPEMPPSLLELTNKCWADDVTTRPNVDDAGEEFDMVSKALLGDDFDQNDENDDTFGMEGGGIMLTSTTPTQHIKKLKKIEIKSVEEFLSVSNLDKYTALIIEKGFTDMESLCDREVLDDETLKNEINMTKLDIRKFRAAIETKGVSSTMLVARRNMQSMAAADNAAKLKEDQDVLKGNKTVRESRESLDFDDGLMMNPARNGPKGAPKGPPPSGKGGKGMRQPLSNDPSMTQRTFAKLVDGVVTQEQVDSGTKL